MTLDPRIRRLGIDTFKPGFYDDPEFMTAERTDPQTGTLMTPAAL
jgi:hypothetical protein